MFTALILGKEVKISSYEKFDFSRPFINQNKPVRLAIYMTGRALMSIDHINPDSLDVLFYHCATAMHPKGYYLK